MNSLTEPAPIIVGVDSSDSSIAALRKAAELAASLQTRLLVITCWTVPNFYNGTIEFDETAFERDAKERQTAAISKAFENGCPVPAQKRITHGRPADELIKASTRAQMLVLGTRGRHEFIHMMLGSVSLECIGGAHCPVLTVRAAKKHATG